MANATKIHVHKLSENSSILRPEMDVLDIGSAPVILSTGNNFMDRLVIEVINKAAANLTVEFLGGTGFPIISGEGGFSAMVEAGATALFAPRDGSRLARPEGLSIKFTPSSGNLNAEILALQIQA